MRLVFIHGRGQGDHDAADLMATWRTSLASGLAEAGLPDLPPSVEVRLPFYGARLDELTEAGPKAGEIVLRGPSGDLDPIASEFVLQLAANAGITDADIAVELGATSLEHGPENQEWVQAAARVLGERDPWLGKFLLGRLTADVSAYLRRPDVGAEINAIVETAIGGVASVVVAHSLGTLVAYNVLRTAVPTADVPLFVTLGSPLGIPIVKRYLASPLGHPKCVQRWINASDPRDPVALYEQLNTKVFPAHIENLPPVHNPQENPHGIGGYLRDRNVCSALAAALSLL